MNKLDKTFKTVGKDLDNLVSTVEEPMNTVGMFVKKHKRLLITMVVVYIVYRYLFSEEE